MKLLFLASYFPKPDNPYMGTWALEQARAFARHPGVELRVLSFTSWVPRWLARTPGARAYARCPLHHDWPGGVHVAYPRWLYYPIAPVKQRCHKRPSLYMKLALASAKRRLRREIEAFKPDAVYAHHTLPNGYLAAWIKQTYGLPFIVTDHDFGEVADCGRFPDRRRAFEHVAQHARNMICVADRMRDALLKHVPDAPAVTVHNGIDPLPRTMWDVPRPEELATKKMIMSCALFAERKDLPRLIRAFARAHQHHPEAVLRLVGDGDTRPQVEAEIERHDVVDSVTLLGRQDHDRVLQEMVWADVFALTGYDEPFATVYLEAMSAGLPVVCCSDGGITDVLKHERHGLHVPPRDEDAIAAALDLLLSDSDLRQRLGDAGRKLATEQLTWDAKVQEIVRMFPCA